jgi:hypothetical protein
MIFILKGLIKFGQGIRDINGQLAVTKFLPQSFQHLAVGIFKSSEMFLFVEGEVVN